MARPDLNERVHRSGMESFLLAGEVPVVADRQHWVRIAEPVASALGSLVVLLTLLYFLPPSFLADLLVWAWIVVLGRTVLRVTLWRRNWFIATDKRMLVNYGLRLVNVNVAMLSMSKVVDLSYTRSTLGYLLGYGTIVRESSGQSQTLHEVKFVRRPDETYRTICAAVFNLPNQERIPDGDRHSHRFEDGPPAHAPGLYTEYVPIEERRVSTSGPIDFKDGSNKAEAPTGIRVRYGQSRRGARKTWLQSPDLAPTTHDTNTGPIPYRRSTTDADDGWVPTTSDEDLGGQDVGDDDDDQGDDDGQP